MKFTFGSYRLFLVHPLLSLLFIGLTVFSQESVARAADSRQMKDPSDQARDVIVQLFNWPFAKISDEMPLLAEMGYGQIHVSPPNLTIESDQWWGRYQPVDYRLIAGPLGDEAEFDAMIAEAHRFGLKIIVDIVFNHTANKGSEVSLDESRLTKQLGPLFVDSDYNPSACISDYNNLWQVRNQRLCGGPGDSGLPDLNQNSEHVLKVQRAFLLSLRKRGVDGFRLDAVKHMEPSYFPKLLTKDITEGKFIFGEIIADAGSFARDLEPYLQLNLMSFYDFPLRATLQQSFGLYGSLEDLVSPDLVKNRRGLNWDRSVAFIMNHDIPNNAGFRAWIPEPTDELLEYAFILGRSEGVPYVYSDLGTAGGAGLIDDRWDHYHRNPMIGGMIKFHNFVFGSMQNTIVAEECVLIVKRGNKGIFAINKCEADREFNLGEIFSKSDSIEELLTKVQIPNENSFHFVLPGRSARMFIAH